MVLQGQVLIKGRARKGLLADDKELATQLKVGMVFQNGALFDSLNVRENVGFMLYEHSDLADDRIEVHNCTITASFSLLSVATSSQKIRPRCSAATWQHSKVCYGIHSIFDMSGGSPSEVLPQSS